MKKQEMYILIDETIEEFKNMNINYRAILILLKHVVMLRKSRISKELEIEIVSKIELLKQLKELELLK